jgi:beta-lactamase regulating signal transducer with metallopeptidase domain
MLGNVGKKDAMLEFYNNVGKLVALRLTNLQTTNKKKERNRTDLIVVVIVVGDSTSGWWHMGNKVDAVNNSIHLSDL